MKITISQEGTSPISITVPDNKSNESAFSVNKNAKIDIKDLNIVSSDFEKWVKNNIPKAQDVIYNILDKEKIKYTKRLLKYWPIKDKGSLYKNIYSELYLNSDKAKYEFTEHLIGNIDTGNLSDLEKDKLFAKIIDSVKTVIPQFKQIIISKSSTLILKCRLDVNVLSFSVSIIS